MGFIDKENERLRAEEQAKIDFVQARISAEQEAVESLAAEQAELERIKGLGQKNDLVIAELLDTLPVSGFRDYLEKVRRVSGFGYDIAVYTNSNQQEVDKTLQPLLLVKGYPVSGHGEDKEQIEEDVPEGVVLATRRVIKGDTTRLKIVHPAATFFDDELTRSWLFGSLPRPEPQGPGIGIRFRKQIAQRSTAYDNVTSWTTVISSSFENVYLRLLAPRTAFITGFGTQTEIMSSQQLDDALEKGFDKTHKTREVHTSYRSKQYQSGGF